MSTLIRFFARGGCAALLVLLTTAHPTVAEQRPNRGPVVLAATGPDALRAADTLVERMVRFGDLRVTAVVNDTLVPGRTHERIAQFHNGVRVFGADVTRQTARGLTMSLFGRIEPDIDLDTSPTLTDDQVRALAEAHFGVALPAGGAPELMILRGASGAFTLVHRMRAFATTGPRVSFFDAHTGSVVWEYSTLKTQNEGLPCTDCAVGRGRGVKGDLKKISVRTMGGAFRADDLLRPPSITTYDMDGDWERTWDFLNGDGAPAASDIAHDADNDWVDGANVDAHVGAGWTYDYLFERFGRRGLDGNDSPIVSVVHPVHRRDLFEVPSEILSLFHLNAFYCGDCGPHGMVVYGEGLPPGFVLSGQSYDFFAGALDIIAHELAHAVTDFTSQLIYRNESGALNEAFSDVIGTAVEFFMAETGRHPAEQADYLLGEDVIKPGGARSLADPQAYGDPDHYSNRFLGSQDNGGVHTNSLIAGHAFYLAIEGGVNRTSDLAVSGVGSGNRAQIERVFYRAFTMMMPADSTFSLARAATIQSARDLFGPGGAVERAVADAWTAVGVE